jgi:hypothetical protein
MIAAGIGNDSAAARFVAKRRHFVISAAQLEGTDGLQVFELQEKLALIRRGCPFEKWCADGDAFEDRASLLNVSQRYDTGVSSAFSASRR